MDLSEIIALVEEQGKGMDEFRARHLTRLEELEEFVKQDALKKGRPNLGKPEARAAGETWIDRKSGQRVPVLTRDQSLASLHNTEAKGTIGRALRGILLGSRADDAKELEEERKAMSIGSDPHGGFTVGGVLASEWVDQLRAAMVLNRAGARTVPMTGNSLALAKVTGDPTVAWHGENAALTESAPTLGAVTMYAKTCVCLVKLSLELSQDSSNIEQILTSTITNAMAQAIDAAGLVGVTPDAGAAPFTGAGIMNLAGRNSVAAIGAPTTWDWLVDGMYELMLDNVPAESIGAMVAHPAVWKKMRKLKTGITNDNTPLSMPEEVGRLPKLWTTAAPLEGGTTAKAIIADWRDLLFGVRQDISVRVLQEAFLGSNLQLALLAYARVDFAAVRPASFCTLEGITV